MEDRSLRQACALEGRKGSRPNCDANLALAATVRLVACGAERPVVSFGECFAECKTEALLKLVNDTELDRAVTVDKLPIGVALLSDDGSAVSSVSVEKHSSRVLCLQWRPDASGSMCGSVRLLMGEGTGQVPLEVRLKGSATEAPGPPRAANTASIVTPRSAATVTPRSTAAGPAPGGVSKPRAAASKTSIRSLSLVRPQLPSVGTPPPSARQRDLSGASVILGPPAVASLTAVRAVTVSPAGVLAPGSGGHASGARQRTPLPGTGCVLDLRHVGSAESKRERGLFAWMNSEVSPLDTASSSTGGCVEGHVVRRFMGEVSRKAYLYFKRDASFAAVASKVEEKISKKQLALKDPETTLSDVRMRQGALELLTSYHPLWLAVGLQTVLGKALELSLDNMAGLMKPNVEVPPFLRAQVLESLLSDQEVAAKFRNIQFKQEYWEALGARVLGRVLLLVLLLDRMAEMPDLPSGTPSLFRQDSTIKSSEKVLLEFLQPRMAGAGDVRHALRMMSYQVGYVQHARDEADYRVRKPVDLRDGTRLAKLVDNLRRQDRACADMDGAPSLVTQPSSSSVASFGGFRAGPGSTCSSRAGPQHEDLLPTMAFPSHTGKPLDESQIRNNCLRLARALQQLGVNLQDVAGGTLGGLREISADGAAKAVADGLLRVDQRITLGLLWQMAIHFKLRRHVDVRALERETARLRRAAAASSQPSEAAVGWNSDADDTPALRCFNHPASRALLQWMKAVCAPYGFNVQDFQWSLADGQVLSLLVHTYLPEVLAWDAIYRPELPTSADKMAQLTGGTEYVSLETLLAHGWAAVYEVGGRITDKDLALTFKCGVAINFAVVHAAGGALGVPAMLNAEDYLDENGPDELTAILYVALLGEALLKLTAERRAGYVIMEFLRRRLCWRPSYMRASLERYKAAVRQTEAATTIQSFWRMWRQRCRYTALREATRELQRVHHAASVAQAAWRGHTARKDLSRQRAAALLIQRHVRRYLAQNRHVHEQHCRTQHSAAVAIQAAWRGFCARKRLQQMCMAAVTIQAWWRQVQAKKAFAGTRARVVLLQAHVRGYLARCRVSAKLQAITCIQAAWRALLARRLAAELRHQEVLSRQYAAVVLQAAWRGLLARRLAASQRRQKEEASRRQHAALVLQHAWRDVVARRLAAEQRRQEEEALRRQRAAVVLQRARRALVSRRLLAEQRRQEEETLRRQRAAVILQHARRALVARRLLAEQRRQEEEALRRQRAATLLQRAWRTLLARRCAAEQLRQKEEALRQERAAIALQSAWRVLVARRRAAEQRCQKEELRCQKEEALRRERAAIVLQTAWRALVARRRAAEQLRREEAFKRERAAVVLQTAWRALAARRRESLRRESAAVAIQAAWRKHRLDRAATAIQAYWRMVLARRSFLRARQAAMLLQAQANASALQELLEASRYYMRSVSAAIRIQAFWRGYVARRAILPAWEQHREVRRKHLAATTIQKVWRGYTARNDYAAMRRALSVIGTVLVPLYRARRRVSLRRREALAREQAAKTIQAGVRMWLARRQLLIAIQAATKIQAAWRGHLVRTRDSCVRQQACHRRLQLATFEAQKAPHRQIDHRTREVVEVLSRANKSPSQVSTALMFLEKITGWTWEYCQLVLRCDGATAMLRLMQSKPQLDAQMFNRVLKVLNQICWHAALVPEVLRAENTLAVLSERLQFFRDTQEVFTPLVRLLQHLVSCDEQAAEVPQAVLRRWESIHQILTRDADMEHKYLKRLEGEKGSDISAPARTQKLLTVQQQLAALEALMSRAGAVVRDERVVMCDVSNDQDKDAGRKLTAKASSAGGSTAHTGAGAGHAGLASGVPIPGFKNTLVKDVLQRMAKPMITGKRSAGAVMGSPGGVTGAGGPRKVHRRTES